MLIGKYSSSAHELLLQFLVWAASVGAPGSRPRDCCAGLLLGPVAGHCWRATKSSPAAVASRFPELSVLRALGKARRRNASSRHSAVGCRCAPRPGARPAGSGTTSRPAPRSLATTRSNSNFVARCRHPTQVRTLVEDMRLLPLRGAVTNRRQV